MSLNPHFPGFQDPVHDAQTTFRALLAALSHPGSQHNISALETAPQELELACAAACLTLLDLETQVWLQPPLSQTVKTWLQFHTGCQFTELTQQATFAIVTQAKTLPPLSAFGQGTAECPEASTTLLVQVEGFERGEPMTLTGPGIKETQSLTLSGINPDFWEQVTANTKTYPLGVDCFFFTKDAVIGFPRTTSVSVASQ